VPFHLVEGLVEKVPASVRLRIGRVSRVQCVDGGGPLQEGQGPGVALEGAVEDAQSLVAHDFSLRLLAPSRCCSSLGGCGYVSMFCREKGQ